jgi:uncharacterized protein (DUF2384 family)
MSVAQFSQDGLFQPLRIAHVLKTTSDDIAWSVGLGKDAVQRRERIGSDKTQRRLREMVEVITKAAPRFGSELMAYAWYRGEPLAGFSSQTAMQLVKGGRSREVLDYLDAVDAGVHA